MFRLPLWLPSLRFSSSLFLKERETHHTASNTRTNTELASLAKADRKVPLALMILTGLPAGALTLVSVTNIFLSDPAGNNSFTRWCHHLGLVAILDSPQSGAQPSHLYPNRGVP